MDGDSAIGKGIRPLTHEFISSTSSITSHHLLAGRQVPRKHRQRTVEIRVSALPM